MSRSIPQKELKALFMLSGGVCAFPDCGKRLIEPGTDADDVAILAEAAHIVAESRQGPRGNSEMSAEDRDKHTNLVLVCGDHHKIIDSQPRTYSVPVLRQLKADHERRIRLALTPNAIETKPVLRQEALYSSLLPASHLPDVMFASSCAFRESQQDEVKQRLRYPDGDNDQLVRFIITDGNVLHTFHNLHDPKGPFADVIDRRQVVAHRSRDLWDDPEGHRRFVRLMNKALYKYTSRLNMRFDPLHHRFYFPASERGMPRKVIYRPLNARRRSRNVVLQPKRRSTGEPRGYWVHLATGLRFQRMANNQWCLSIRPEYHLTKDGEEVLPSDQIGRRVTRKKSRMHNYVYLREVNFWRDYLSNGGPRVVLNFGDQSAVIGTDFLTFDIPWPGIPGDDMPFKNKSYSDDLFTRSELDAAVDGVPFDWEDNNGNSTATNDQDI